MTIWIREITQVVGSATIQLSVILQHYHLSYAFAFMLYSLLFNTEDLRVLEVLYYVIVLIFPLKSHHIYL